MAKKTRAALPERRQPMRDLSLPRPRVADVMNMAVSLSDHGFRQQVDPRRRPEIADARMIQEDQQAIANLPTRAIHRQWTPGKFMPHYWMESEVSPVGVIRFNEPEDDEEGK